jgi:hypothetical protein
MLPRPIVIVITLIAGLIAGSCSTKPSDTNEKGLFKTDIPAKTPGTLPGKNVPDKTILFFMNPNGRPCQMQSAIIDKIKDTLAGLAKVTYIKTTERSDLEKFEKYGVRGLPSLIILDKYGKELSRFPPGIQNEKAILSALRKQVDP